MLKRQMYLQKLQNWHNTPLIKVLTGMRRSGKSTLLRLWQAELVMQGVPKDNIFFVNLESLYYEHLRDYRAMYDAILSKAQQIQGKLYILLDEVQEIVGWERVVNSCRVDLDCDIIVTGSNAKLLSGELATLLAGRYVELKIYPLSFGEYIDFVTATPSGENVKKNREQQFADYLRFGGLPGIHQLHGNDEYIFQYLSDIFNSILLKDIVARYNIRDTALLESIIRYIMDNIGNTFSAKTVADFLKNQGRRLGTETVYNYIQAMETACLLHKAVRYDIKGKRLLETQEKYYLADLGIRHAIIGYKSQDIADLLENTVYLELKRRGYTVYIGKQQNLEVDFVAEKQGERLYIQVCYWLTEDNIVREFKPLEQIDDNYEKFVLSMNSYTNGDNNGIRQRNIIDFLLQSD